MATAATTLEGPAAVKTEAGVPVIGPGPVAMSWTINGKRHEAVLEPRTTLLDALREHLDLTGAKRVCDRGTCGACTVIADGKASERQVLPGSRRGGTLEILQGVKAGEAVATSNLPALYDGAPVTVVTR